MQARITCGHATMFSVSIHASMQGPLHARRSGMLMCWCGGTCQDAVVA
jgi:hypothetical protein